MDITLTIDADDFQEAVGDLKLLHQKPMIPDPDWTPTEGVRAPHPRIPKYTDEEWVKEIALMLLLREIERSKQRQAINAIPKDERKLIT